MRRPHPIVSSAGESPSRRVDAPLTRRISLLSTALFAILLGVACAQRDGTFPNPAYSPGEIVRIQVEALAANQGDAGIELAFRFASPANKRSTGPIERFVQIVRAPAYLPMLNHRRAEYGPADQRENYAAQVVTIIARDGSRHRYIFELSRQVDGAYSGCWMTDSVRALTRSSESIAI